MVSPDLFRSFDATAYCHGPAAEQLDLGRLAATTDHAPWSEAGAPTIYLAGDPGVLLAELGRHVVPDDVPELTTLWRVRLHLERGVDLR